MAPFMQRTKQKRPYFTAAGGQGRIAWPRIVGPRFDDAGAPKADKAKLLTRRAPAEVGI